MANNSKKSTRKFEKRHLKDALERRKVGKKVKQQVLSKEKRKKRTKYEDRAEEGADRVDQAPKKIRAANADKFAEMSVDEFLGGGFEIPDMVRQKGSIAEKTKGKRKRAEQDEDDEEQDTSADESVDMDEGAPVASDDGDESEEEETGMNKETIEALAETDPEFYSYLKENDPEVLDFDKNMDLQEMAGSSDSDAKEKPRKKKKKTKAHAKDESDGEADDVSEVTQAMIEKWKKAMAEQNSLRAMRQVVLAFKAAAHINEGAGKEYKYTIASSDVYHELLLTTLQHVPGVLDHHLPVKESSGGKKRVLTDSKKFKSLTPLLKSHLAAMQHLLRSLSDAATLRTTLDAITPLLPYFLPFRKALKSMMANVVDIWSDSSSTESTRITAFLVLRRLVIIGDPGLRDAVLKLVYQGLVKGSRITTVHTMPGINLMKNSAAELWGIDQGLGYTTGFVFIRQLAIHLRKCIKDNKNEAYKAIYNWQYIHSLDFWSCVLSEHCSSIKEAEAGKASQLKLMIYPTVQLTLGAMRLIPTATYFPLRFYLMRSLLRLSRATGTYIPLASALLEVLDSAEMKKHPKASTLKSLDFATNFKAPKSYLRTRVYQDGVGDQIAELLAEFFVLWTSSIAFPELALPVIVMLKRWLKETGKKHSGNNNNRINSGLILVVQKLEANSKFITERRAKVEFAPNNRAGVESFLKDFEWEKTPLGAFVQGQRKQREEKVRLVEQGRHEDEEKREKEREQNTGQSDHQIRGAEQSDEDSDASVEGESDEE